MTPPPNVTFTGTEAIGASSDATAATTTIHGASPPVRLDAAQALRSRYGTQAPTTPEIWNDTLASLLRHRSVRAFRSDPLPRGTLDCLVAAAQSASSSSNLQTWSVVVIEDPERKERLSMLAGNQKHIRQAPLFLVWLADLSRFQRMATSAERPDDGQHYLETFLVSAIDATLAAQNAFVALESLGLNGVYIGAMRNHPGKVAAELGLPPHAVALFGLCVGYADPAVESDVKPRLPQRSIVHHETYSTEHEGAAIAAYDDTLRQFQQGQRMASVGWTATVLNRLGSIGALNGRDKLRSELCALGFPLR